MRFPACGFLPQISHCCAMMTPENFRTWGAKHRFYRTFDDLGKIALSRCRCSKIMLSLTATRLCHPVRMVTISQKEFQRVKVIENAASGRLSVREAFRLPQLDEEL